MVRPRAGVPGESTLDRGAGGKLDETGAGTASCGARNTSAKSSLRVRSRFRCCECASRAAFIRSGDRAPQAPRSARHVDAEHAASAVHESLSASAVSHVRSVVDESSAPGRNGNVSSRRVSGPG